MGREGFARSYDRASGVYPRTNLAGGGRICTYVGTRPPDLQSGAIDYSATPPRKPLPEFAPSSDGAPCRMTRRTSNPCFTRPLISHPAVGLEPTTYLPRRNADKPGVGLEPTTYCLQNSCSAAELSRQIRRGWQNSCSTNPSYMGR